MPHSPAILFPQLLALLLFDRSPSLGSLSSIPLLRACSSLYVETHLVYTYQNRPIAYKFYKRNKHSLAPQTRKNVKFVYILTGGKNGLYSHISAENARFARCIRGHEKLQTIHNIRLPLIVTALALPSALQQR